MATKTTSWTSASETTTINFSADDVTANSSTFNISCSWNVRFYSSTLKGNVKMGMIPSLYINNAYTNNISYGDFFGETGYVAQNTFGTVSQKSKTYNTRTYFTSSNKTERSVPFVFYINKVGAYYQGWYSDSVTVTWSSGDISSQTPSSASELIRCNVILDAPPSCQSTQVVDTTENVRWTQGRSIARTTISNAKAQYGGDVSKVKLTIGSSSAEISGNGTIDVPIIDSGIQTPQVVITDSRGQETTYTLDPIDIMGYNKPSIESINLERHTPEGSPDETQVYLNATIKQSPIDGNVLGIPTILVGSTDITNNITWYNESTHETIYTSTTNASKVIYGIIDESIVFSTGSTYTFTFTIDDSYGTSESKTEVLPTIFITMDFQAGGKEIAFGDKADDDVENRPNGLFKCSMDFIIPSLVGEIKMWAGNIVPNGWLLCDGSEVLKADYPILYSAIGDLWGTPTNPDCFVLPNMCGKIPVGLNPDDEDITETFGILGSYGGARGAWSHNHTQASHRHVMLANWSNGSGSESAYVYESKRVLQTRYTDYQAPAISANGSANNQLPVDKANMPPYAVIKYIICAY